MQYCIKYHVIINQIITALHSIWKLWQWLILPVIFVKIYFTLEKSQDCSRNNDENWHGNCDSDNHKIADT